MVKLRCIKEEGNLVKGEIYEGVEFKNNDGEYCFEILKYEYTFTVSPDSDGLSYKDWLEIVE